MTLSRHLHTEISTLGINTTNEPFPNTTNEPFPHREEKTNTMTQPQIENKAKFIACEKQSHGN